jgi:hypothetical protein
VFYRKTLQGFVTLMQGYHCVLTTFKIRDIPFPTHFGHYIELLLRSLMIDQIAKANMESADLMVVAISLIFNKKLYSYWF